MAEETPTAAGQIYGFRTWAVDDDGLLRPMAWPDAPNWVNGENVAACQQIGDQAPVRPVEPVAPVHPDTLDPAEVLAALDPQPHGHYAGRRLRVGAGLDDSTQKPVLPELFPGERVDVGERQRRWEQVRQRALSEYARDQRDYEKKMILHRYELEFFQQRYEAYEQEVAEHISPMPECKCGFYMVREYTKAAYYGAPRSVLGVVRGYGKVVPYTDGWRFGRGNIVALLPWKGFDGGKQEFRLNKDGELVPGELSVTGKELLAKIELNYPDATVFSDFDDLLIEWQMAVRMS